MNFVTNDPELEKIYTALESDGKLSFYDLDDCDWKVELISEYLNAVWKSFDDERHAALACRFFSALSVIQKFLPKSLVSSSVDFLNPLYSPVLQFLINSSYNVPLFNNTIESLRLLGVHQQATTMHYLALEVIMKYLCSSDSQVKEAALTMTVQTMNHLGKESFFLIPFFADFLERGSICLPQTKQASFAASAYAILKSQESFDIPSEIGDSLRDLASDKEQEGHEFAKMCMRITKKQSDKDIASFALEALQKHESRCFPVNEFMTVFLEELLSDSGDMTSWLTDEIGHILTARKLREPSVRFLSFLSRHIPRLRQKMPKFWPKVGTIIMSLLDEASFRDQALIVETMMAVARHEIANVKMLFASCEGLDERIIQHCMMAFYAKRAHVQMPKEYHMAILGKSEKVYVVTKCENGFDLFGRSSAMAFSFHVEQVAHAALEAKLEDCPECGQETKEFQAAEHKALTKLVSSLFGQCEMPELKKMKHHRHGKDRKESEASVSEDKKDSEQNVLLDDGTVFSFFSTFYDMKDGNLQVLLDENATAIRVKLSHLFSLPWRSTAKIGIVYVTEGQFNQQDIFTNTASTESKQFRNFLHAIAQLVDLNTHKWYDGVLSKSDGPSFFYENEMCEVMYHVLTRLRDDPTDKQRLAKKRHIGNDPVHIVWCENHMGYDPKTITSQFNDCHLIIYPYGDNLFRVVVHKKNPDHCMFPLPGDCFVTAKALPLLAASTAILADAVVRSTVKLPIEMFSDGFKALLSS